MALPELRRAWLADEVLALVLLQQKGGIAIKHRHRVRCAQLVSKPGDKVACLLLAGNQFGGAHAACSRRRACTSKADSAAGVMPGTRPAAASETGAALLKRSTISFDRPGTCP